MTVGDVGNAVEGERLKQYKNAGKHEDMRRRRTDCSVEIRKQKRDDMMMKRRNVVDEDSAEEASDGDVSANKSLLETTNSARSLMTFSEIIEVLSSNPQLEDLRHCFENVRRALSKNKEPPVDEVIKSGLLQALIQGFQVDDDKIRFEAAWAVTNIVSGTSDQTKAAVEAGAILPLVQLMHSPNLSLAEQCLWAVANITGDSAQMRDKVIQAKGLDALMYLVGIIDRLEVTVVRTLAWAFSNMCRHKKPNAPLDILKVLARGLVCLLSHSDKTVRQDACWAASYLTDGPDQQIKTAIEAGVMRYVIPMLDEVDSLVSPALRVLGNMATGNDDITQYVIDAGTLPKIRKILYETKSASIAKECCWLISNIIAGTHAQIQAVLDDNLLPMLLQVLDSGDHKSQHEASWAIANLTQGGTSEQILRLWTDRAVPPMCQALKQKNNEILVNILDAMYALVSTMYTLRSDQYEILLEQIEEHGGLDIIEGLQQNENERVYSLAYKIVQEFFSADEDSNQPGTEEEDRSMYSF